jgi:transcriptional regulator with XRE-family HTH domain
VTEKRPDLKHFKSEILKNEKDNALYEKLEPEYSLLDELIAARQAAGLTQEQIAKRMGTQKSNISRFENSLLQRPSPTLETLEKYAAALNCHLEIRVIPNRTDQISSNILSS